MTASAETTEQVEPSGVRRTALILPVPEAEPLVSEWRARWDPNASLGVPAHITLLFPFLPEDKLTQDEVTKLRAWFSGIPETNISLNATGQFEGVLYLIPEPAAFFRDVTLGLWSMYPDAPPYGGIYDDIKPHLTVVKSGDKDLFRQAERELSRGLPIVGRAREAWLLLEATDGRWHQRDRLPLRSHA